MRRLLSILLLAAFALPLIAPGFALAQDPDAALPACCRRHGQHQCAMLRAKHDQSMHYIVPVCPAWPLRATALFLLLHPFMGRASSSTVYLTKDFSSVSDRNFDRTTARDRAHLQRGPPLSPSLA